MRDVHTGTGIGGPWSARHHADPRPAGQFALGLGHHRGPPFLAANDETDRIGMIVEGVQNSQIAFAGNAEHGVDTMDAQLIGQDLTTSTRNWRG